MTAFFRLKTAGVKIALVGPLAEQFPHLLGNYNGIPTHSVPVLEGMRAVLVGAQVHFLCPEHSFSTKTSGRCPEDSLTTDGKPGAKASYYSGKGCVGASESGNTASARRHPHRNSHREFE